jgi:hypothetical protein
MLDQRAGSGIQSVIATSAWANCGIFAERIFHVLDVVFVEEVLRDQGWRHHDLRARDHHRPA